MSASAREAAAWVLALTLVSAMLGAVRHRTLDPDSELYASISADLATMPVRQWVATMWNGHWDSSGPFIENPAGTFFLPAVFGRYGYPREQAAYAVNALFQVLTVVVTGWFAALFVPIATARVVSWGLLLLPVAFAYRIRANHEQLLLLAMIFALYSAERSRTASAWLLGVAAATIATTLVKGVFVVFVPLLLAAWAAVRMLDRSEQAKRSRLIIAVAISIGSAAATACLYEDWYRSVTGEDFLALYLGKQFGVAAQIGRESSFIDKLATAPWYVSRIAWFSFPWGLVGVFAMWQYWRRRRSPSEAAPTSLSTVREGDAEHREPRPPLGELTGALFCLAAVGVYVCVFGLFARRAERYVVPAYFFAAAPGLVWWLQHSPRGSAAVEKFVRRVAPYERVLVWLFLTLISLAASIGGLPKIGFRPPNY